MREATESLVPVWLGVLTHLWQTSLVLLPLLLLERALRRAPARLSELLWGLGLAKLLLPVGALCSLVGWGGSGDLAGLTAEVRLLGWERLAAAADLRGLIRLPLAQLDAFARILATPPGVAGLLRAAPGSLLIVLTTLWGLGVFLCLALLRREATARPLPSASVVGSRSPRLRLRLAAALAGTSIPRRAVRICPGAAMPATVGLWRPYILVPRALVVQLATDELRAILLHEDAHRARRDPLRAVIRRGALALLFFYPLVWPLLNNLRAAAEFVCDEAVLRAGVRPGLYARALARTVELNLLPTGGSAAADPRRASLLHQRFARLDHPRRSVMTAGHRLILATGVLLFAVALALPQPSPDARAIAFAPAELPPATGGCFEGSSADDVEIEVLDRVKPLYPEDARQAGVGGRVELEVLVGRDGRVARIKIVRGVPDYPSLARSAREAVQLWRFKPPQRDGKPTDVTVWIPVVFKIDDK